jgi:asparagine synthetase B (glutamine-hydrolysing)
MAGMVCAFGFDVDLVNRSSLWDVLDPYGKCETVSIKDTGGFCLLAYHLRAPYSGPRVFEDSRYFACLDGDLVSEEDIPWSELAGQVASGSAGKAFLRYRGTFAIVVFDKKNRVIYGVSDRLGQHPLYYHRRDETCILSSSIAPFCRLFEKRRMDVGWMYEYLFFNFPTSNRTPIEGVSRVSPASVVSFDLRASGTKAEKYADSFKAAKEPFRGAYSIEKSIDVFGEVVPRYYHRTETTACALTAGFDTRTLLALRPRNSDHLIETYTYGITGASDLLGAKDLALEMGWRHDEILLDDEFLSQLPWLIYQTVYLSGGLQNINRSMLPFVYRSLAKNGAAVALSGVSGGQLIRGDGNVPSVVSQDMLHVFKTGKTSVDRNRWDRLIRDVAGYEDHIMACLGALRQSLGPFDTPEAFFKYLLYQVAPRYFAGEAVIAGAFLTFRNPYWDADIIEFLSQIASSAAHQKSQYTESSFRKKQLQATLISQDPHLAALSIHGTPLDYFVGRKTIRRAVRKVGLVVPRLLSGKMKVDKRPPCEDWAAWHRTVLLSELGSLLGKDCFLSEYVLPAFIEEVRLAGDVHWIGKLATVEIVSRLIESNWKLPK